MAKFRIDSLAVLARQLEFTPHDARVAQLAAAEELLHGIEPGKAYPIDFIIFRITGYHPRAVDADLLTGLALQHDLGLLIERVSDSLSVQSSSIAEPVLAIEDVCARFNVTSKTIQRWRRKGLPARRFIFPDGRRRVGFLVSSVERFFSVHQDQVARGTNFSQIDLAERGLIIRRARRLATSCQCCVHEIARRVARRLNRSPATILHTIRKHDQEHPQAAVFPLAADDLTENERARILRGYRRGLPIRVLAKRSCRPRSAIYRVLLDERLGRLSRRKVKFIDDPLYHQPDAAAAVALIASPAEELSAQVSERERRIPRDLPPYLAELYRTPLLTPARERALFLAFNFHKFRFVTARRRIDPQFARARDVNLLEGHFSRATAVKNEIVRANLRLVVSVARQHLRPGLTLMELISEGNITLMRAVESFDAHRGYRFSTYATLALMKGFARTAPRLLAQRRGGDPAMLASVADPHQAQRRQRLVDREEVRHLLSLLDDRERRVVRAHFGLEGESAPATLDQIGSQLGISSQRARQIERSAIAKLRHAAGLS